MENKKFKLIALFLFMICVFQNSTIYAFENPTLRVLLNETEYSTNSIDVIFRGEHNFSLYSDDIADSVSLDLNKINLNKQIVELDMLDIKQSSAYRISYVEFDYSPSDLKKYDFKSDVLNANEVVVFPKLNKTIEEMAFGNYAGLYRIDMHNLLNRRNNSSDYVAVELGKIRAFGVYENNKLKYIINEDTVISSKNSSFNFKNVDYRGGISFYNLDGGIVPLNIVNLEEYLYSVVGKEMSSSYPLEALKAQAVAARTYAINSKMNSEKKKWDLYRTTLSQLYTGINGENDNSISAVNSTRGNYMAYDNKPISAFYSANNGGISESGDSLYGDFPYLIAKIDAFSATYDKNYWNVAYTNREFSDRLKSSGYDVGVIDEILITNRNSSKRVDEVVIKSDRGNLDISGKNLRKSLGYGNVKSTLFSILKPFEFDGIKSEKNSDTELVTSSNSQILHAITSDGIVEIDEHRVDCISSSGVSSFEQIYKISENPNGSVVTKLDRNIDKENYKKTYDTDLGIDLGLEKKKYSTNDEIVIYGAGYGHGVGMSQYGAKVMALQGYNYMDILKFYYNNVEILNTGN